jgi:chemotaxis signal transduction protein
MTGTCVRVSVGGEHYALSVEYVLEVGALRELTTVPGSSLSVLGVINRDGHVLPVVNLATVIRATSAGSPNCMVVVDDGRRRACLAVDEIIDVGPTPTLNETTASELLTGAALIGGSLVGMLEIGSVLDAAAHQRGDAHGR